MNGLTRLAKTSRLACGLVAAALLTGATIASASECNVAFNSITRVTYSDYDLDAYVLDGEFNGGVTGAFTVTDDDGFLSLAALMSRWQSTGKAQLNATSAVRLSADEVALIIAAAEMGQAY